jgi:hypothetical protein
LVIPAPELGAVVWGVTAIGFILRDDGNVWWFLGACELQKAASCVFSLGKGTGTLSHLGLALEVSCTHCAKKLRRTAQK